MKKIFYRTLILIFLGIFGFVLYLTTIGIKTDRFNNQISAGVKKINDQLELELKILRVLSLPDGSPILVVPPPNNTIG